MRTHCAERRSSDTCWGFLEALSSRKRGNVGGRKREREIAGQGQNELIINMTYVYIMQPSYVRRKDPEKPIDNKGALCTQRKNP